MGKMTLDEIIAKLPPDRQKGILAKSEEMNASRSAARQADPRTDEEILADMPHNPTDETIG